MADNESSKTRELCKALYKIGAHVTAIVGSMRQRSGLPDRYVNHILWHGWLEFKLEGGKVSATQELFVKECCKRQYGSAFIATFMNSGELRLTWYDKSYTEINGVRASGTIDKPSRWIGGWFATFVKLEPVTILETLAKIRSGQILVLRNNETTAFRRNEEIVTRPIADSQL